MLLIMAFIYLLFSNLTRNDFYQSLHERTEIAARLYLEADEISPIALNKTKNKYINSLPEEEILIYDSTNEIAFTKDSGKHWTKDIIDEVRKKKYLSYKENGKQIVGIYYHDNQGDFVILASAVDSYGQARKHKLLQIMGVLFCIQILIQFAASRWFAQKMLYPIQEVNKQVKKISATDLHLRVKTDSATDEIGLLALNFNGLLDRLEKSFDLQKMFVANSSHELKTPITNIIGEVEVALSRERTSEDYKENLLSVLAEAERLQTIITDFLLLTNAENNPDATVAAPVRIDELLWEIKEDFQTNSVQHIDIQLSSLPEEEKLLYVNANKALLTLAIKNVIQNGLKFSKNKPIVCILHISGKTRSIRIIDQGIGMEPEVLKNIFEPFFRSPSAKEYPGNGIGLYITKKIIELFNGRIEVSSQKGNGSCFNIIFEQ